MHLDVPTLMVAGAFVSLMSGALLLFAWYQYRETAAALWWAGADFTLACAIVMLAVGSGADIKLLFNAGLTGLCISAVLTFAGARSFDGHPAAPLLLAIGPVIWIAALWSPASIVTGAIVTILNTAIVVVYYVFGALSIHRGRGEALRARMPLIVLVSLHAATLAIAVPATLTMTLVPYQPPPVLSWFGIIHFETLIFAVGTALFMVAMMKERNEGRLLESSHTDALTGAPNRRGFFLQAERALERCRIDQAPAAVILFDLDRFKTVNDNFGHAGGDQVLKAFCDSASRGLRPSDVLGRIGGEEFAVILPGSGIEAGHGVADRIRKAFAEAGVSVDGRPVKCTVSGGVAASAAPETMDALLKDADAALYRAKSLGRNRIECFEANRVPEADNVIRVA